MAKDTSLFVKKLAHNDDRVRRQAFEALKQYLRSKSAANLSPLDYDKLCKGLYYSMWFCDKPIPQQNLAHDLGTLFSEVVPQPIFKRFHSSFWRVFAREWYEIDKWRIDKYLMLIRRVIRHNLFRLQAHGWPESEIKDFQEVLSERLYSSDTKVPPGIGYHVCDLILDEIEYVVLKDFRDYSEEPNEDDESDSESEEEEEEEEEEEDIDFEVKDDSKKDVSNDGIKNEAGDDAGNETRDPETEAKKAKVLSEAPLAQLVQPFRTMAESGHTEVLRKKCREEIVEDERLQQWGLVDSADSSDSEDEWMGF